jgi:hypothetical protein
MVLKGIAAHQVVPAPRRHFRLFSSLRARPRSYCSLAHLPSVALPERQPIRICPRCGPNITDKNHLKATRPIAQELNEAGDRLKFFLYHNLIVFHA